MPAEVHLTFLIGYVLYFLIPIGIMIGTHWSFLKNPTPEGAATARQLIRGAFAALLINLFVAADLMWHIHDVVLWQWMVIHMGTALLLTAVALCLRLYYLRPAQLVPATAPAAPESVSVPSA